MNPLGHDEHAEDGNGRAREHDDVVRKGKFTKCAPPQKYSNRRECSRDYEFGARDNIVNTLRVAQRWESPNTWRVEGVEKEPRKST